MLTVKYYRARNPERESRMLAAREACSSAGVGVPEKVTRYLEGKTLAIKGATLAVRKGVGGDEYIFSAATIPIEAAMIGVNVAAVRREAIMDLRKWMAENCVSSDSYRAAVQMVEEYVDANG